MKFIFGGYGMKKLVVLLFVGVLVGCATIGGTDITETKEYIDYETEARNVLAKISTDSYTSERELHDDLAVVASRISLIDSTKNYSRASLDKWLAFGLKFTEWTDDHRILLQVRETRDRAKLFPDSEQVTDRQMEAIMIQYGRHIGEQF
jgi:hypothetical protein